MTDTAREKKVSAAQALKWISPLIANKLFNEKGFRTAYGLKSDPVITLGLGEASFTMSEFFKAVPIAIASEGKIKLTDMENRTWDLANHQRQGEFPQLILSSGKDQIVLPDFCVLSDDVAIRIASLEKTSAEFNLPNTTKKDWKLILNERPLEGDEVDLFYRDIQETPVNVSQSIFDEIYAGKSSVSALVPNSRKYFERLVGVYDGSTTILDYARGEVREVTERLMDWRPYDGFLFSLFFSSHSALSAEINIDMLNRNQVIKAFSFIAESGDKLSQLGAVEVGMRALPSMPEIEPYLLRIVHQARDDEVNGNRSEFKLFSALFILVDGELAKGRLLAAEPPFYRRLASMAHAALIHRQMINLEVNVDRFVEWALNSRSEHFHMQSLTDMRIEPRWNPGMVAATQLQAEFFARIIRICKRYEENLSEGEMRDTVLGDGSQSLSKKSTFPSLYYPGPLEGAEENLLAMPSDITRKIDEQLDSHTIDVTSFAGLVNTSLIFKVEPKHATLAAKALRVSNYTLANLNDKNELLVILNGVAKVAAVSRNSELANELRVLVRRYLRTADFCITVIEAMQVVLIASAAHEDLIEWRNFAGEWLTELAFGDLAEGEVDILQSHLSVLLHLDPGLWVSCAKADAALEGLFCSRK